MQKLLGAIAPVILGMAALGKFANLSQLAAVIRPIGIFQGNWAAPVAYLVVSLECLAFGFYILRFRLWSYVTCMGLYGLFTGFHVWNFAHGIGVPCHCFGPLYTIPPWISLPVCVVLLGVSTTQFIALRENI